MRTSDENIPTDLESYDYDTRLAAYALIVEGVVREVREETGFEVQLTGLLTVDSHVVSPGERIIDTTR